MVCSSRVYTSRSFPFIFPAHLKGISTCALYESLDRTVTQRLVGCRLSGNTAFDECVHTQPDPLPGLGAATTDLDAYTRASVLLEGEQNSVLPCEGCKQHATPCTPQNFLFPLSNTCACGIMPGKGAVPV